MQSWLRRFVSSQSNSNEDYEYFIDLASVSGRSHDVDDVQVLLYQSDSGSDKTLLYDSRLRLQRPSVPPTAKKYATRGDAAMYREIMFGSVPTAFSGQSTKVHLMQDQKTIFMTKLFQVSELDYKARIKTIMVDQPSTEGKPPYRRRTSQVSAKTMQKKNSQARLLEGREYPSTNGRAGTDNSVSQPGHSQSGPPTQPLSLGILKARVSEDGGYMQRRKARSTNTSIEHGHFKILKSTQNDLKPAPEETSDQTPPQSATPSVAHTNTHSTPLSNNRSHTPTPSHTHSNTNNYATHTNTRIRRSGTDPHPHPHSRTHTHAHTRIDTHAHTPHSAAVKEALSGASTAPPLSTHEEHQPDTEHDNGVKGGTKQRPGKSGFGPTSATQTASRGLRLTRNTSERQSIKANGVSYNSNVSTSTGTRLKHTPSSTAARPLRDRPLTFGIGILFQLSDMTDDATQHSMFEEFFFTHFSFIEMRVQWLYASILNAATKLAAQTLMTMHADMQSYSSEHTAMPIGRKPTAPLTYQRAMSLTMLGLQENAQTIEAVQKFKLQINRLYQLPRLREPVWLTMATHPECRSQLGPAFLNELCTLYGQHRRQANTRNSFASAAITALLAHHLAWVPTLVPTDTHDTQMDHLNKATLAAGQEAGSISFNPLWAQLNDLYGGPCNPPAVARTVVVGSKDLTSTLVFVMSYFLRCFEVFERIEVMETGLLRTGVGVRGGHGGQLDRNKDYNRVAPSQEIPSDLLELSMPSTRVVRIIPDISKGHSSNSILNQSSGHVGASSTSAKPNTGVSQDKPRANTTNPGTANSSGIRNLQFGASTTTADSRRVPMNDTSNTRNSSSSSNSNSNSNSADNYNHNNFVNMYSPKPQEAKSKQAAPNTPLFIRSLGRSLIGGCFETYEPDFALQAVPERDFLPMFCRDLLLTVKDSVIEEPVSHAVGVIADSKSYEVTVLSTRPDLDVDPHLLSDAEVASHIDTTTAKPSALITFMLQAVTDMWNLGLPSETCLWHLEDHLQNVYFKSKILAEVMADLKAQGQPITKASLATAIGVDATDIALLLTVMDTYINNSPAR